MTQIVLCLFVLSIVNIIILSHFAHVNGKRLNESMNIRDIEIFVTTKYTIKNYAIRKSRYSKELFV